MDVSGNTYEGDASVQSTCDYPRGYRRVVHLHRAPKYLPGLLAGSTGKYICSSLCTCMRIGSVNNQAYPLPNVQFRETISRIAMFIQTRSYLLIQQINQLTQILANMCMQSCRATWVSSTSIAHAPTVGTMYILSM